MGANVDTEVCKMVCPFADKGLNGICGLALHRRKPKQEVCVSTVDIRIDKKKR